MKPADVVKATRDEKTREVLAAANENMAKQLKAMFMKNIFTKLAAVLVSGGLKEFKKMMDSGEVGGTALLGVQKPVIKAHGSSDAYAICSAAGQAIAFAESTLIQDIAANAESMAAGLEEAAAE